MKIYVSLDVITVILMLSVSVLEEVSFAYAIRDIMEMEQHVQVHVVSLF